MKKSADEEIVSEGSIKHRRDNDTIWTDSLIKKYLRQFSLGPGKVGYYARAKNRYKVRDIHKAEKLCLNSEPKDADGFFKNERLSFLQEVNSLGMRGWYEYDSLGRPTKTLLKFRRPEYQDDHGNFPTCNTVDNLS